MSRLGLVHLARYSNGVEPFQGFLGSYEEHPPGIDHNLVIVFKGFPGAKIPNEWRDALGKLEARALFVGDEGVDIGAYLHVTQQFQFDMFCFLNSFSLVLDSEWLAKMVSHQHESVGVISATGSWESTFTNALTDARTWSSLRRLRQAQLPSRRLAFRSFPNPHVRTNAFLIYRDVLLNLDLRAVAGKAGALRFESGRHSLTRQLESKGLAAVVVGRDGHAYPPDSWRASRTFRSGDQENLLVADNRTGQYARADPATKAQLASFSWGGSAISGRRT